MTARDPVIIRISPRHCIFAKRTISSNSLQASMVRGRPFSLTAKPGEPEDDPERRRSSARAIYVCFQFIRLFLAHSTYFRLFSVLWSLPASLDIPGRCWISRIRAPGTLVSRGKGSQASQCPVGSKFRPSPRSLLMYLPAHQKCNYENIDKNVNLKKKKFHPVPPCFSEYRKSKRNFPITHAIIDKISDAWVTKLWIDKRRKLKKLTQLPKLWVECYYHRSWYSLASLIAKWMVSL